MIDNILSCGILDKIPQASGFSAKLLAVKARKIASQDHCDDLKYFQGMRTTNTPNSNKLL
jgi:hypothetical protein